MSFEAAAIKTYLRNGGVPLFHIGNKISEAKT